jgi:ketosteroid isomerase-like protein
VKTHVVLLMVLSATVTPARAQNSDSVAVAQVVAGFHAALASGDSVGALSLLSENVLILESGGMETRSDYRAHHLPADIGYARAVPSDRTVEQITVRGDVAWVVATSRTQGTYRERTVNSAGAELMVLARESSGWRIRAIHWSSRAIRPAQPGG